MTTKKSNSNIVFYKNIGLFFGSFNPIHVGHLIIAQYMLNFTELQQVWFVVSPQNPFKDKKTLAAEHHRLNMIKLAIDDNEKLRVSDIEFSLPQPSYTIHTLTYLEEKYPERNFYLIMGSDNLINFHKWKNYEEILKRFKILVYPRPDVSDHFLLQHENVIKVEAPLIEISSSFIRNAIKAKKSVKYLLCEPVINYINEMMLYQK